MKFDLKSDFKLIKFLFGINSSGKCRGLSALKCEKIKVKEVKSQVLEL